jgi:hypothetical protein
MCCIHHLNPRPRAGVRCRSLLLFGQVIVRAQDHDTTLTRQSGHFGPRPELAPAAPRRFPLAAVDGRTLWGSFHPLTRMRGMLTKSTRVTMIAGGSWAPEAGPCSGTKLATNGDSPYGERSMSGLDHGEMR